MNQDPNAAVSLDANLEPRKKPRTRARGWAREVQGKVSRDSRVRKDLGH